MLSGWTSREGRVGGTAGKNHTNTHTHTDKHAHTCLSAICRVSRPIQPKTCRPFSHFLEFPRRFLFSFLFFYPLILSLSCFFNFLSLALSTRVSPYCTQDGPSMFACVPESVPACMHGYVRACVSPQCAGTSHGYHELMSSI